MAGRYNFLEKLENGFGCFYGMRNECSDVPQLAIMYVASFASSNVFSILLIRYVQGAVYTTVALALVSPISTLFWNLFSPVPHLHWSPFFDLATVFVIVGLCIMTPAVAMYSYFGLECNESTHLQPPPEDNDDLPIRYHQGMPRVRKPRSWSVTYVDLSKHHGRRSRSLSDLDRKGRPTSDSEQRERSPSDIDHGLCTTSDTEQRLRSASKVNLRARSSSDTDKRTRPKSYRSSSRGHRGAAYHYVKPKHQKHAKSTPIVYM